MSFVVGQKNYVSGTPANFLTEIKNTNLSLPDFYATRLPAVVNSGVTTDSAQTSFNEECLHGNFIANTTYYFHGKILQIDTPQTFTIKLTNQSEAQRDTTQFIKKIIVQQNKGNSWVDVAFIFTPLVNFDSLVFSLSRSPQYGDYTDATIRYPVIIYNELSTVNNYLAGIENIVKIGVQSYPGLLMCINNEAIRIGKSGVYELKSNLVMIDSFSVITASNDSSLKVDMDKLGEAANFDNDIYGNKFLHWHAAAGDWVAETGDGARQPASPTSLCRIDVTKERITNNFAVDYMYKVEEE